MGFKKVSANRVDFDSSLTKDEIKIILEDKDIKTIQFSEPVSLRILNALNNDLFSIRNDIEFRVYGFYNRECDLSILKGMWNVKNLSIDCIHQCKGVEFISEIPELYSLSIGIYNLDSFNFLNYVSDKIENLFISSTKSKKPNLYPIVRFRNLKRIYLEGQQKGIEVLSNLSNLEDITLRSITLPDLKLLNPLTKLWSLDIKLGGTRNLSDLSCLRGLKYLELWQIKGLNDISVISSLKSLQFLFLQSLPQINSIPNLINLRNLRRIYLENLKGLKDISSLEFAPSLEEFIFTQAQNIQPEEFYPLLRNQNLKRAGVWFGSEKRNQIFEKMLSEHNIELYKHHDFRFF